MSWRLQIVEVQCPACPRKLTFEANDLVCLVHDIQNWNGQRIDRSCRCGCKLGIQGRIGDDLSVIAEVVSARMDTFPPDWEKKRDSFVISSLNGIPMQGVENA